MRRDLLFPAVLVVVVGVMGIYAISGQRDSNSGPRPSDAKVEANPIVCTANHPLLSIVGLEEASGLASSRRDAELLWSHNDSGEPMIYGLARDGKLRGRLRLAGASVGDWEAIATSPCDEGSCVYVADIGDNDMRRGTIVIYRAPEPQLFQSATASVDAFEGVYPEGPQDAEAIFLSDRILYVITKGDQTPIRIYRFPTLKAGAPTKLELVASLTPEGAQKSDRVTDAAVSPDGVWVAMRSNDRLLFYRTTALLAGQPGTPLSFDLTPLQEPQGEGIAWVDAKTIYLAGEGPQGGTFGQVSCTLPS